MRAYDSGLYNLMNLPKEIWGKYEQLMEFVCVLHYDRNVRISCRHSCHLLIVMISRHVPPTFEQVQA